MDLSKIKQFVKQNGDKFIFVENGEPDLVVMSFQEYERLTKQGDDEVGYPSLFRAGAPELESSVISPSAPEQKPYARFSEFPRNKSIGLPVHLEDIRLEDLPV